MSTLPFLLSLADELDNITNNHSYLDDFGLGFYPHRHYYRSPSIQLSLPANTNWLDRNNRHHQHHGHHHGHHGHRWQVSPPSSPSLGLPSSSTEATSSTSGEREGFKFCMNVQQFKSTNDLLFKKSMDDNCIAVERKRDEYEDEMELISRQSRRRYTLPKGYDPDNVLSTFSSSTDGKFTVQMPPSPPSPPSSPPPTESNERTVEIHQSDLTRLSLKDIKDYKNDSRDNDNDDDDDDDKKCLQVYLKRKGAKDNKNTTKKDIDQGGAGKMD